MHRRERRAQPGMRRYAPGGQLLGGTACGGRVLGEQAEQAQPVPGGPGVFGHVVGYLRDRLDRATGVAHLQQRLTAQHGGLGAVLVAQGA